MFDFAYRNLMLFFKDKAAVLLSFLAEFIVAVLYILFIRSNLLESFSYVKDAELLMDIWMIAGLLGITSVTTTMGAYGIMVDDKAKKIEEDFVISPIPGHSLLGGYMAGAVMIGMFMTILLFLLSGIYMLHCYKVRIGAGNAVFLYMVMLLNTVSNSSMVLFLVSFLKSSNALASCCTILGALIGFLTGIYLPMGSMPDGVQQLVKCFPVSHGAVLFRQILMKPFIEDIFGNAGTEQALHFMEYMGVRYFYEGRAVSVNTSIMILMVTAGVFLLLTIVKTMGAGRR